MTKRQRDMLLEALSISFNEIQSLVNDLICALQGREAIIEELQSQVEELENDKLTLLAKGRDLDELVEEE